MNRKEKKAGYEEVIEDIPSAIAEHAKFHKDNLVHVLIISIDPKGNWFFSNTGDVLDQDEITTTLAEVCLSTNEVSSLDKKDKSILN
tara:strand:+ start:76 stop:336 length:261 start_codon:yes stop_codon:yes gene_type:complete